MKSILITGGTGSFGNAFTQKLLETNIARIRIFSRCEVRQHEMENHFRKNPRLKFILGDVADRDALRSAMEDMEVVVHAAALKRIEACHFNPRQAKRTNIDGAENVAVAAKETGVKKVVALSTDKAYEPISFYGVSKLAAEGIILGANNTSGRNGPRYSCTRYGNIWASRGSIYPKWQSLLALGRRQDITISDPECTRFYMRMDEAIELVLSTIKQMPTELAIPRLPAYRLGDLADAMGIKSPRITGLPSWEKRHESMSEDQCSETAPRMSVEELRAIIGGSLTVPSLPLKLAAGR